MSSDSIGMFLEGSVSKQAEIAFPAGNINIYQEEQTPENSGDLLEYAEPWGGPQNVPYVNATKPNGEELDMTRQGERPDTFVNAVPPEDFPVSSTEAWGQLTEKYSDPASGGGVEPSGDFVAVKPRGNGPNPVDNDTYPIGVGEPYEYQGEGEEQTFSDRVYTYASDENGDKAMSSIDKKLVQRVVEASIAKGSAFIDNPHKIKLASFADLYSFGKVSNDVLIHKSSQELWSVSWEDGCPVIEKQFSDDGKPVRG